MTDEAPSRDQPLNIPLRTLVAGATVALVLGACIWAGATGLIAGLGTGSFTYDPDPAAAAWARAFLYLGIACAVASIAVAAVRVELRRLAAASHPALVLDEETTPDQEPQAAG